MTLNKLLFALIFLTLSSCYYDIEDELYTVNDCELPIEVSFTEDVYPIVSLSCAVSACHSDENQNLLSLESYNDIIATIENETFQTYVFEEKSMPPSGALNGCDIELIKKWIASGTPNN